MSELFTNKSSRSTLFKVSCLATILVSILAFRSDEFVHKLAEEVQQKLNHFHNSEAVNLKIRKCEITISDEGFLRYRRTYLNGKQEYYSLNVSRLRSIDYLGSTSTGSLNIRTLEDDVIVQTYNDRTGNVDSMAVQLTIELKAVEPEDLQNIQHDLLEMKRLINQ